MNNGKYYFAIVFAVIALFGLTGSAIAAAAGVTPVAITGVPIVIPASSLVTVQSTNIFQQIISFFEGLFGISGGGHISPPPTCVDCNTVTTMPYYTTTICPSGTAGCPIHVTTTVSTTTTVPQSLVSSCVAALGLLCESPTLANGTLSLTFGQNTGATMYYPKLACSSTSLVPSTFYPIFGNNPLQSGSTIYTNVPCQLSPAENMTAGVNAYLWLSYQTAPSGPTVYMLAATMTLTGSGGVNNTKGGNYSYTGVYNGTNLALTWVPNHAVENLSDARLFGVITNFQTANPYYSCLNGESMNVWSAPNEYPGVLVVHNGLQGQQCTYITATFTAPNSRRFPNPYNYTYSGNINSQQETLSWVPNHSVENDSGATLIGTISNFQTANPYYSCLNGESINIWIDPNYPNEYVIHNGLQGPQCTYITATFVPRNNSGTGGQFSPTMSFYQTGVGSSAIYGIYVGSFTGGRPPFYVNFQVEYPGTSTYVTPLAAQYNFSSGDGYDMQNIPNGQYSARAFVKQMGSSTGVYTNTVSFTVTGSSFGNNNNGICPTPYIYGTTTDTRGPPGTVVAFEGVNFGASTGEVQFFDYATSSWVQAQVDSWGSAFVTATVPNISIGETSVDITPQCGISAWPGNSGAFGYTVNGTGSSPPNPYNYTYSGNFNSQQETLSWVQNRAIENDSGATLVGTISNFQTANPYYSCLNGESINVWTDPNYPNEYVVHNGLQGPQCTYITEVFSSGSTHRPTPILTIMVNRPQNMPKGTNFETNMSWTNLTSYSAVYNCNFIFQTTGGMTVSNYTEYCGLSDLELGWNYSGVGMQPGGNYYLKVIVSNRTTGRYVSASNTGYIAVPSGSSTPLSAGMNLTVRQTGTQAYPVILDMMGTATGGSGSYTYTYQVRNMSQLYYHTIYTSPQTTSGDWTYGFYNNTVTPNLVPGITYSAVVTVTDSQGHTASSQPQSFTIPGNASPNPYNYSYTGSWEGSQVTSPSTIQWVPNHTVENDSGAVLVGTLTNFQTANPQYSCLNGRSLNVWTDPNYPGVYVIHNGMQGSQCAYITLEMQYVTNNQIIYVGHNVTSSPYTVELTDLGQASNQTGGMASASISIYYNGALTNMSQINPNSVGTFKVHGEMLYVFVHNTFEGLYAYQRWANMSITFP